MIGVFDSGVGGLAALAQLRRRLPRHALCYLADTAHLPYGAQRAEDICRYVEHAVAFLADNGAERVLIACGTASSLLDRVRLPIPVLDVIRPASRATAGERILLLATERTVREGVFARAIAAHHPQAQLRALACPALVELAENGQTDARDPAVQAALASYLAPVLTHPPDTLVLGCTHFSHFSSAIKAFLPYTRLIDSGILAADTLADHPPAADPSPTTRFFATDQPSRFAESASAYLGQSIRVAAAPKL